LKPIPSPDQQPQTQINQLSPTSPRRGIRRQTTVSEDPQQQQQQQQQQLQPQQQQQQQPLKSGWSSNPNLTDCPPSLQPNNQGNLTKRVKLAKATQLGRWTSMQSGQ
jgi:hypothetical protein